MFFLVINDIEYCLVFARDREDAKRQTQPYLGADPDQYELTPLTPKEYTLKALIFGNVVINNKSDQRQHL